MNRERIQQLAFRRGFNRFRVASVEHGVGIGNYDRYLSKGRHGTMSWMVRSRPPRVDCRSLLPSAQSVIVLGVDYRHPIPEKPSGLVGRVSCYAWGRDYHNLIGKRLRSLCKELKALEPTIETYFGVDSRPFIERAWAERAGMGFVGKNCMIISPADSSYFFLGMILINRQLPIDRPITKDHCGRCRRCLDRCPTNAFVGERELDSRKCISYLTIEHKGDIPQQYWSGIGNWLFGCDVCQEVCPHNHRLLLSQHPDLAPRPKHAWVDLEWLFRAADSEILEEFTGTPLRRTGVERLRRNAAVTLSNVKDPTAKGFAQQIYPKVSPMVQRHLQWSLS